MSSPLRACGSRSEKRSKSPRSCAFVAVSRCHLAMLKLDKSDGDWFDELVRAAGTTGIFTIAWTLCRCAVFGATAGADPDGIAGAENASTGVHAHLTRKSKAFLNSGKTSRSNHLTKPRG